MKKIITIKPAVFKEQVNMYLEKVALLNITSWRIEFDSIKKQVFEYDNEFESFETPCKLMIEIDLVTTEE